MEGDQGLSRSLEQLELMLNEEVDQMEEHEVIFWEWEKAHGSQEPPNNTSVVQTEIPPNNTTNSSEDDLIRLLTKELREAIKAEVKDVRENEEHGVPLNPDPLTYYIPMDYNDQIPITFHVQTINVHLDFELNAYPPTTSQEEKKKNKRQKAMLAATKTNSFKLSEDCMIHALNFEREKLQTSQAAYRFSFIERLDGWRIERKMRPNSSHYDMYFEHERSKGKFRSINEVINFILHEAIPR